MAVNSLRARLLLVSVVWIAAALIAAGFMIQALLRDFVVQQFDARLDATMIAVMGAIEFDDDGALALDQAALEPHFDQVFSGWYWQVADADAVLLRSRSLWTNDLEPGVASPGADLVSDRVIGPRSEPLRVRRRSFTAPGAADALSIAVAGPKQEIEAAMAAITPVLATSLALLGAGLALAVLLQVYAGLQPLDRLRADLRAVRGGRIAHLPEPPLTEIAPVVREINALIDHRGQVVDRARTHVGNLAHSLQTPLAVMANELASRDHDRDGALIECVEQMRRIAQHHLRRARAAAMHGVLGAPTPVAPVVEDLVLALRAIHADRALLIATEVPPSISFAGERHDLEEMIGNLLDNACKWASSRVEVAVTRAGSELAVEVRDDGPGMSAEKCAQAMQRGARLDASMPGFGFGLAIVQDLVTLYGGTLALTRSPLGGLGAQINLPAVVP